MKNRGAVLIVVLGVLAVLALLSTTFASLTAVERQVSRNYLDTVRAKLIAQSGVEEAVERLTRFVDTFNASAPNAEVENKRWRYYGDDVDETGTNPALLRVPLEEAKNPSYAVEKNPGVSPEPRLVRMMPPGKAIGYSGMMDTSTYGRHGDLYSLRITDLQGLIHVNDGLDQGPDGSVSQNLKRILNNLGQGAGVAGLGDKVLAGRPSNGYHTKRELLRAVNYDASIFNKFKDFVSLLSWQDSKVCNPVPLSDAAAGEYPIKYYRGSPPFYRYGRGKDASGRVLNLPLLFSPPAPNGNMENAIYGYDELNPQWVEIVTRAPVNINSAPREVLTALLDGLKGFFVVERRRNEPPAMETVYAWLPRTYNFRPSLPAWEGGELGYLYSTVPIQGPGSGTGALNSWAIWIAEEIIACREKKKSPHVAGLDYATATFGGPFRCWRQFNLFCDRLADAKDGGFLVDTRDIYFDYHPTTNAPVPSEIQKRYAGQAIADVLKANFNPNVHLNETNPEFQLWLRVDKTDLIVNSTEFCFTPMGLYEIESIGRVLFPKGNDDALVAANNEVMAFAKISATVKLADVYRETHQSEFAKGTLSARKAWPPTNNNMSIEIGPEPDNGLGPSENEWSGYLALPTIGGEHLDTGWKKTPKTLESTPLGSSEMGSAMHAHFTFDARLHHHASGKVKQLACEKEPNTNAENAPDRTESTPGPYTPLSNGGNRHRLARSFRLPRPGCGSPPPLFSAAPLDLRLDGVYLERHCGLAFWLDASTMGATMGESQGVFSFWVKPGFFPEMTGKSRAFLSADRMHAGDQSYVQPSPFCLWCVASHDSLPYQPCLSEGATPIYNLGSPFGVAPIRTNALTFGYGYSGYSGYQPYDCIAEGGCVTPTLNHESHSDAVGRPSYLRGHRWIHLTGTWDTKEADRCKVYINGKLLPGTTTAFYAEYDPKTQVPWFTHEDGTQNCLRLGATSAYNKDGVKNYQRNWPADATIDEFHWWNSFSQVSSALELGRLGRFYNPCHGNDEAIFTSQEINLLSAPRSLAPPSSISTPGGGPVSTTMAAPPLQVRLLSAQWTLYGEFTDPKGPGLKEMIHDYHGSDLGIPHPVSVEFSIVDGETVHGPWKDLASCRLADPAGNPIVLSDKFRYKVRFVIDGLRTDSELRATPIVDDITILYRARPPQFLSYCLEN